MAERQIRHRKSCLVLSAHFPVVNWRSRPVAKSAYYLQHVLMANVHEFLILILVFLFLSYVFYVYVMKNWNELLMVLKST